MKKIELAHLLDAGVHLGHKANRWNPKMFPYIYTERNQVHIIDLIQTIKFLRLACTFSENAARNNETFLFIGTNKYTAPLITAESERCGAFYINHRWLGGMLTNWGTIKNRIERLKYLEEQERLTTFKNIPKKEAAKLKKELEKLKKYFSGVKEMKKLPDNIIIIDQRNDIIAVKEALSLNIQVISILDTNCDPDLATIPIPGNDDSIKSLKYLISSLVDSICLGHKTDKKI
uniref:Small ribosomal subunit protein uS2c n=1 Tax=Dictyopteris divaricata TaxID=156996 RepID=A0A2I4Q2U3_9PHAE|nr:30S ribosomal protein S2 [Dictyopteris divaricata]YP_010205266.1 30S ribosomal protein S2 [Grateloupia livida]AQZ24975.1 30S ribosomal protein S2 [Dictyopteris divaricata]UAV85835.1 30S ribosomal protein S2 [Grateloupia livida]